MLKVKSVTRIPVTGKGVSKLFFRSRVQVSCEVDPAPGRGKVVMARAIRKVLQANAVELGFTTETKFWFSDRAGQCNAGWGHGTGFILNHAVTNELGENVTTYIVLGE